MNLLSFILIFISTGLVGVYAEEDGIENIAKRLGDKLAQVLENLTNYTELSKIPKDVTTKTLEEAHIKSDIENLTKLFEGRLSIAQEMAKYAEKVYANHTTNDDLDESYVYFDAVGGNVSTPDNLDGFSDGVTFNTSAVQTPTDLYQYTSEILNSIAWTDKLDKKFRENFDNESIKAWQYIGLSNGVYRFYPGASWPNGNLMKYYDVRQRPWYIEGSSSPKDMVIILDLSGSVIGNRLLIIKSAILKLLDTLQENDFVSIIYFNKNAHYLKKCWDHLVQATERNKKILKAAIKSDSVDGENVANVDEGFKRAFQTLENARKMGENKTSECTQTIAFFSDGVEGDTVAEDVFDRYNRKKEVRVFTYLVGRENGSPFEALKWIACNNRGFFYRIETLSDVRQTMVKYLTVLSRSRYSTPKWTPLYLDALGLGMTSALVVPIFDKTNKKQLGVLGSDVRLDEILSNFPEPHLGSGGYPFIITNNGLVFYHPLLETEEGAGLKHPANVYISELLHHFDNPYMTKELAKNMINGEVKQPSFVDKAFQEFLVLAKYNNKFRIVKRSLSYSYKRISDTSFSAGTAVTDYGSKLINEKVDDDAIRDALKQLEERNVNISIAKNWPYCSKPINDWEELKTNLTNSKCTDDLTNLVKYDITKLGDQHTGWMPKKPSLSEVQAILFGTTSGLTFYNSAVENVTFNTSIKQEYFERAADSWKERTIIFSAASQNEAHASKAVVGKDKNGNKDVLWGVVGIHMNSTYLRQIVSENHNMCETDEDTFCYLVDENGYVVSSEKEEENGEFFGTVEGNVMEDLINQSVYEKYNFTDVQATCEPTSDESSSSIRLLDPFFSVVNYAKWWTQTIALSLIQYSLYSVLTGTNQVSAEEDNAEAYACFKKMDLYYRKENVKNGPLSFSECTRSYNSSLVKNTNLLLVIVNVQNSTFCKKKLTTAEEVDFEGSCYLDENYRVPAVTYGECVPNDTESRECSSGKLLIPSIGLLVLLQIWLLMLQKE